VPNTALTRLPEKRVDDRAQLDALLDHEYVAHVGLVRADGSPVVIPTGVARDGDRLLVHGSTGGGWLRELAGGAETCATVTLLDGVVVARSHFESSMHYRSAMVFGTPRPVADKLPAMRAMSEQRLPGRWDTLRPPTTKELAATMVLALPLDEWSVKVSDGPPEDDPSDLDAPVWAGVLPIVATADKYVHAPDLRGDPPVPEYLRTWSPA